MAENHILVVRGFDIFTRAAAPMVRNALSAHCGPDWWANCVLKVLHEHQKRGLPSTGNDEELARSLDAARLLILIDQHWNSIFKEALGFDARNWIKEAIGGRNKTAHRGAIDFAGDDSWRMLDTLRLLLGRFDQTASQQVASLRDFCDRGSRSAVSKDPSPHRATQVRQSGIAVEDSPAARLKGSIWVRLQAELTPGRRIRNWTKAKGYFGEDFSITRVSSDSIQVEAPSAKSLQTIPAKDFLAVNALWHDYVSGKFARARFMPITRYSKYVISILHHLYTEPK